MIFTAFYATINRASYFISHRSILYGGEDMKRDLQPTNSRNVTSRLFFRFFICYLATVPVAALSHTRGVLSFSVSSVGMVETVFVMLALLGALLTIAKPYLYALTLAKAFYDGILLCTVTAWARAGSIGILSWNACFLMLILSLLLFAVTAARAELFAFLTTARDTRLLFSRRFAKFLAEAMVLLALSLSLYYLWPQILAKFGIPSL